jgi:hypothetical protein
LSSASQFGRGLFQRRHEEQRVVAEAARAARRRQDLAVPLALGDERLRVVGVAHQHQHAVEMGAAVADAGSSASSFALLRASDLGSPA